MISYEKYNVFIKISFFLEQFKIHDRIEGQYWDVLCTTCPHICIAYLIMNITHQSSMFVLVDEPTLTHHAWVLSCFSGVDFFVTLWTVACQTPLSMGLSRQE